MLSKLKHYFSNLYEWVGCFLMFNMALRYLWLPSYLFNSSAFDVAYHALAVSCFVLFISALPHHIRPITLVIWGPFYMLLSFYALSHSDMIELNALALSTYHDSAYLLKLRSLTFWGNLIKNTDEHLLFQIEDELGTNHLFFNLLKEYMSFYPYFYINTPFFEFLDENNEVLLCVTFFDFFCLTFIAFLVFARQPLQTKTSIIKFKVMLLKPVLSTLFSRFLN
jgi:hypothetical protein